MPSDRRVRLRRLAVLGGIGAVAAVVALSLPGAGSTTATRTAASGPTTTTGQGSATTAARLAPTTSAPPVTTARATAPPTTDPGTLPQTTQRPTADDPLFAAHVQDLWRAVVDGQPAEAMPFFFPVSAYVQVKAILDPVYDYETRLVANFDRDIQSLHASLGGAAGSAAFIGVTVPDAAEWIVPGVEANKGSYWRVYGTRVEYTLAGQPGWFEISSMISWRGEWYDVHLGQIR